MMMSEFGSRGRNYRSHARPDGRAGDLTASALSDHPRNCPLHTRRIANLTGLTKRMRIMKRSKAYPPITANGSCRAVTRFGEREGLSRRKLGRISRAEQTEAA
jgi:hypothetical protein